MTAAVKNRKEPEPTERQDTQSDRRAYYPHELPKSTIEAIKRAKMDSRHDHLNALLD
jgi:hypothetical protein